MKIIIDVKTNKDFVKGLTEESVKSNISRLEDVLIRRVNEDMKHFIESSKFTTGYFEGFEVSKCEGDVLKLPLEAENARWGGSIVRDIVKNNEGLNTMLNEIVDFEMNKTFDEIIEDVKDWQRSSSFVSCETVIAMLESIKNK